MKAWMYKTSGLISEGKVIEVETLDALLNLARENPDDGIIVSAIHPRFRESWNIPDDVEWVIEVYDDSREQ
jgi:hypothetical protein